MAATDDHNQDAPRPIPTARRRPGWVVSIAAIGVTMANAAWTLSDHVWPLDLAASLTHLAALASAIILIAAAIRLRWGVAAVATIGLALGFAGLASGRSFITPEIIADRPAGEVRLILWNASATNTATTAEIEAALARYDADVLCLVETPAPLVERLKSADRAGRPVPPFGFVADRAGAGVKVMLSQWPQRPLNETQAATGLRGVMIDGAREAWIDRPEGAFAVALFDADSPRTAAAWARGNAVVDGVAVRARDRGEATLARTILVGDLNGGPASHRERLIARNLGVRRAKPLLRATGTFPAAAPWPFDVAIDAVYVGSAMDVVAWSAVDLPGGDHRAVVVDIAFSR